jgi:integrase
LHKALADAVKWGLAQRNIASLADPPKATKTPMRSWDAEQLRQCLVAIEDDRLRALWTLAASTGMRRSELLGLGRASVDLYAKRLSVRDTLVVARTTPVLRRSEGKSSAAHSTIALDSETVEVLREHRRRQLEERIAAGPIWENLDLVFTREDGSLLRPGWVTKRFRHLVEAAGLPWIGLHGLRHTHATMALLAGVPAKVVSERLGHSSVSITLDRYSHVLPNMQSDAAERIAEVTYGRQTS